MKAVEGAELGRCVFCREVLYNSAVDIAGFQFIVDGDLILTNAYGGAAAQAGFMVSFSGNTIFTLSLS